MEDWTARMDADDEYRALVAQTKDYIVEGSEHLTLMRSM
jgi:hypothetical protein